MMPDPSTLIDPDEEFRSLAGGGHLGNRNPITNNNRQNRRSPPPQNLGLGEGQPRGGRGTMEDQNMEAAIAASMREADDMNSKYNTEQEQIAAALMNSSQQNSMSEE